MISRALQLLLTVLIAAPAAAQQRLDCLLEASPNPAWPGANVTLRGESFPPGADITVAVGFFPVYDGFIGPDGIFQIAFRVPDPFDLGPADLVVQDHTGLCNTTLSFAIAEPPPPPPPITPLGLALFAVAGMALGVGVMGVVLRRHR